MIRPLIDPAEFTGIEGVAHLCAAALVYDGLSARGWEILTPGEPDRRAGSVCFRHSNAPALADRLAEEGVLVWGSEGRVRVSGHLYNGSADVERFFQALDEVSGAQDLSS